MVNITYLASSLNFVVHRGRGAQLTHPNKSASIKRGPTTDDYSNSRVATLSGCRTVSIKYMPESPVTVKSREKES